MLIYEVNYTVAGSAAPRFSPWVREHVREMLDLDGFEAAVWLNRHDDAEAVPEEDEPTDPRGWTVHYQVRDREALQAYLGEHADAMQREGVDKFGEHVESSRRLFEQKRLFQG
ncbi:MAG: DUF4286 domain-containing protein [Bacteroidetes bacterium SW_9_63_38]|nr:MAG: DUF4286 domain-containing protein [Bacteroidetes bacterium SW_9_63_38]